MRESRNHARQSETEEIMRPILVTALLIILCGFAAAADVYKIDIDDTIQPVSEDYISRAIAKAEEQHADALIRSYVAKRGRNVEAAENAVRKSLSFTDEEALKQNIIDVIAKDDTDLLKQIDGRTVTRFDGTKVTLHTASDHVVVLDMSLKQRVLSALLDPNLAYILFAVGMMALYAEFNHPGAVVPGVIGGICILLALFAMHWLPIRFSAAALILLAFVFFALEAKFQSHGALGIGGIVCMIIGAMLLVDGPIPEMRIGWKTAVGVALPFGAITVFLTTIAMRARAAKVVTGEQGMIGMIGIAKSPLTPQGKVFVNGELWNAVALAPVKTGQPVRVRSVHGLTVEVEPETTPSPTT